MAFDCHARIVAQLGPVAQQFSRSPGSAAEHSAEEFAQPGPYLVRLGVPELNDPATQPAMVLAHHSGDLAALSKVAPALFLRGFENIADWRPPQPPYASRQTPAGNHQRRTPREGRLHRTR